MRRGLSKPGLVLNEHCSVLFLVMAAQEGFVQLGRKPISSLKRGKHAMLAQECYSDLLASALISGGVNLVLPPVVIEALDCSKLASEGIPVTVTPQYTVDELKSFDFFFRRAYRIARLLERDIHYSHRISYEDLTEKQRWRACKSSPVQFAEHEDCLNFLSTQIQAVTTSSPELNVAWESARQAWGDTVEQLYGEDSLRKRSRRNLDGQSVFQLMDLYPRTFEQLDKGELPEIFPENYFDKFADLEARYDVFDINDGSVVPHIARIIGEAMTGPVRLSAIHSYWRSLFDQKATLQLSAKTGGNIHLLRSFEVTADYPRSDLNDACQLFKLYIDGVSFFPRLHRISEMARLYHHPYYNSFRDQLGVWQDALLGGEADRLKRMGRDFELATRDLRALSEIENVGKALTIVSLPIALLAMIAELPVDFGFTLLGPALLGATSAWERKVSWVRFGNVV